jgi:hypothetical protein
MSSEQNMSERSPFLELNNQLYKLEKKITLGSAEGLDIVIKGHSIAPKQCIFRVQKNVVSIMDMAGKGTIVERKTLGPGRRVLISEDDELQIGDLHGKIVFKSENEKEEAPARKEEPLEKEVFEQEAPDQADSDGYELDEPGGGASLEIELEGDDQQTSGKEYDEPDQNVFDIDEKPALKEKTPEELEGGYELSLNEKPTGKMGTIITKMTIGLANLKQKLHLAPPTDPEADTLANQKMPDLSQDNEEDVDPELLNQETMILGSEDGIPIREKLKKVEELKKASRTSTKNLLQSIRKEGGQKNSKIKIMTFTRVAGVNIRLLSVILDFFICSTLLTIFIDSPLTKFIDSIKNMIPMEKVMGLLKPLEKAMQMLPEDFREVSVADLLEVNLSLFLLYILFRSITTLFFGVSFGQFLFGLRGIGGPIFKRLSGFFRTLIEPFTGPFLIFDFPCVLKRPTLKEVISRTGIQWNSKISTFITVIFICPLILIYLFRGQIVGYVPSLKETFVIDVETTKYTAAADTSMDLNSDYYRLSTKFKNFDKYWIYPSFKIQRMGKKNIISPLFYLYHPESGWEAEVFVHKDFKMRGLAQSLGDTVDWLDSKEVLAITKDNSFRSKSSEVLPRYRKAIENFWLRSLSLHWKNLHKELPLAKTGLVSYYFAKKYFWEYLNIDEEMDIHKLTFKNIGMFLISPHKQDTPLPLESGYLLPVTGGDVRIYGFNWSKRKTARNETLYFLFNFLYEADFNFMNAKNEMENEKAGNNNFLNSLDVIAKTKTPIEEKKQAAVVIFEYYQNLIKNVLETNRHRKAKKRLIRELDKLKLAISLTGNDHPLWVKEVEDQIDFLKEKFGKIELEDKEGKEGNEGI